MQEQEKLVRDNTKATKALLVAQRKILKIDKRYFRLHKV
jgi:hypothetical protein